MKNRTRADYYGANTVIWSGLLQGYGAAPDAIPALVRVLHEEFGDVVPDAESAHDLMGRARELARGITRL